MKIIAGNSNRELAEKIAEHCFTDLVPNRTSSFVGLSLSKNGQRRNRALPTKR